MKKIVSFSIIALIFTGNVFAASLLNSVVNIFADKIYCPQMLTATKNHFIASNVTIFSRGYSSSNVPANKEIIFYFTNSTYAESSGAAQCHYASRNGKMEYTTLSNKPIKPNTDSISNNWSQLNIPLYRMMGVGRLSICRYNPQHCPFMNY